MLALVSISTLEVQGFKSTHYYGCLLTTSFNTRFEDNVKPYTNLPSSIYIITRIVTWCRPHWANVTMYCTRVTMAEGTDAGGGGHGASGLSLSVSCFPPPISFFSFLVIIVSLGFLPGRPWTWWTGCLLAAVATGSLLLVQYKESED